MADAGEARRVAEDILSREPFTRPEPPRPFRGLLERFDELVLDPIRRFLGPLGDRFPDVGSGPWIALAAAVIVAAVVIVVRTSGDRGRERAGRRFRELESSEDPETLDAAAAEAEAAGRLEAALRLRFRAGLLRLGRLGAVEVSPGVTNAAVARRLRHGRFDGLAGAFDEVVYGGRPATAHDVGEARAGWAEVLAEVGSRP